MSRKSPDRRVSPHAWLRQAAALVPPADPAAAVGRPSAPEAPPPRVSAEIAGMRGSLEPDATEVRKGGTE